jgi:hypothetical protein
MSNGFIHRAGELLTASIGLPLVVIGLLLFVVPEPITSVLGVLVLLAGLAALAVERVL